MSKNGILKVEAINSKRQSTGATSEKEVMSRDGILKAGNFEKPGDVVAIDQCTWSIATYQRDGKQ